MLRSAIWMCLLLVNYAVAEERQMQITAPMYFLPPTKSIVLVAANAPGPDAAKHQALATLKLGDTVPLPGAGPFDVWYAPKDGKALRVAMKLKPTAAKTELKLQEVLGVISVKGDGQPRGRLLVTPYEDEGPEAKKHVVVQTASDVNAEMAVLPGDYAVWVVPENGARPRRIADKVRVLAGKTATVE